MKEDESLQHRLEEDLHDHGSALAADFLIGGGETGALLRAIDWSKTPLGPPTEWPQSLRSALSICLGSRFPIAIYWGQALALLYNDAWSPIPGGKHPWALGRAAHEVWPEIWDTIGPLFDQVLTTGEATYSEDSLLPMYRHGYVEECYFNFTFTPIRGESGRVDGVFNAVVETTFRVISERRNRVLRELGEQTAPARSIEEACTLSARSLARAQHDVPFLALYLVEPDSSTARLASTSGFSESGPATPDTISLGDENAPWPFAEASRTGKVAVVNDVVDRFGPLLPRGPWPEPINAALVAPILVQGRAQPSGFLVLGTSPRRAIDDEYCQFAERAASQVASVLSAVTAYEEERRRGQLLADLDRAKTTFFSNVSHELRTPLTLILGPAEDLLAGVHGDISAQQRDQLETLQRNALRLHRLVNELLDFSRIEAGRIQASYERTDLSAFTRELASVFRSAVTRAGLDLEIDCSELEAPVFVDREMWEKIVLNLLSNALKFTFEGSIDISLRQVGDDVCLRVRDTGVGISKAELPRLFERFHRVEGARARTHEGSGIGLALVQELVKLHGGSIGVESEVDVGTTFLVKIPSGTDHLPKERISAPKTLGSTALGAAAFVEEALRWLPVGSVKKAPSVPPLPSMPSVTSLLVSESERRAPRVLLADDNADMRDYLKRLLEQKWTVHACADGVAALSAARAEPPDLVLTDVMMPNLDGFGLVRALRADPRTRAIPIVMLSARAGEEAKVEGLHAGADDYIVKPFSARELLARIETHLELSRLRTVAENERAKLHALFTNAPAMICMLKGPDHVFELTNPPFLRLIGNRQVLGRPVREAVPELVGQGYFELLDQVYRTGSPYLGREARVNLDLTGNGELEEAFVNFVCQPSYDVDGNVDGVLAFVFDVTDQVLARKKLEEQRRAAEEARLEAEAAVRMRDEFLSVASHELRTPLTTLGLQTDSALRLLRTHGGVIAARPIEKIEKVRRSADRLDQLVQSLLDVSRIVVGRLELQLEEIDLAGVAREVCERFQDEAGKFGSQISCSVDVSVVGRWDPMRLDQVLTNLLSNAIKYGQSRPIDVNVHGTSKGARIRVRDHGIGIAAEDHDRIFERFERAVSNRHFGGLGLGLWISRQVVEAMGGRIWAESERTGGTSFIVELPTASVVHEAHPS